MIKEITQEDVRKIPREKRKKVIKERAELLRKKRKEEKKENIKEKALDYYYSHRSHVLNRLKKNYQKKLEKKF